ncbi:MAG: cellulose biosynthesis cyclic di-GMP-binding regulatory protein BcsB [Peptostreptococcaceae bacterium]|jgi:hypothetical protein|nr:cellulose biosynthesis cyclic di-GMP-binding regulatory protein BcsB [Peptostreptococcaceae bacterium]
MKKSRYFLWILIILLSVNIAFAQTMYRYQVGYYENNTYKLNALKKLRENGLKAYSLDKRVYVGDYSNKGDITKLKNKIEFLGFKPYLKSFETKKMKTQSNLELNKEMDQNNNSKSDLKQNLNKDIDIKPVKTDESSLKKMNTYNKNKKGIKDIYPLEDDFTLQGVFGTTTFFFEKDEYWKIDYDNSYLDITFNQSGIKEYNYSTITILINDIPVKSENLYNYDIDNNNLRIKLRKDILEDGFNSVKISLFHRITEDDCNDNMNIANWLVIRDNTYIHLEYNHYDDQNGISNFPYPFILKNDEDNINTVIALPSNPSNDEIKYAIELNSYLSSLIPLKTIKIPIKKLEDLKDDENAIIIMDTKKYNKLKNTKLEETKGYIRKEKNKKNKRLYISGNLKRSFDSLTNEDFVKQMKSNKQLIDFDYEKEKQDDVYDDSIIEFRDLGYTNVNLEGVFHKKARFSFEIPNSWELKEGSKIHLKFRYPEFIDLEKSSISTYINGDPIASKALDKENANLDILEFEIPKYYLNDKFINLEIMFYLAMDDYNCKEALNSKAYSSILNDSYLDLPHEYKELPFFEDYPNPFVKDGSFDSLDLVMEDNSDFDKINLYSYIISAMTPYSFRFFDLDIVNKIEEKDKNYILISTPDKDKIIKELSDNLNIKFSKDFKSFMSDEKAKIIINENNTVASMQLIASHLNKDKSILYITATNSSYLDYIYELSNEENLNTLKGDVLLLSDEGIVDSFYYQEEVKEEKEKEVKSNERAKSFNISGQTITIIITLFVFFIAMIILLLYRIIGYRRKK